MKKRYWFLILAAALIIANCKKPYTPKVVAGDTNFLVVEGVINTGGDSTIIKLSRTVKLNADVSSVPELNATVAIQDDQNQSYSLSPKGNGYYVSPALTLDNTRKYRLSISTADGKIYESDYEQSKVTPAIDSIGYKIGDNGVNIYVNTHDPANNTRYYRWDYTETWQFNARFNSQYISNGTDIVHRTPSQDIFNCYGNSISSNIILGTSAKLAQDVIFQNPVTAIATSSEKIETKYSILLKQYAITKEEYDYFTLLKKNTEELGSIFDAQPSQLTGNIHCTTDATLPVIGFVTVGTVQQKRIFISNTSLPQTWFPKYPYDCIQDSAWYSNPRTHQNDVLLHLIPIPNTQIPTSVIPAPGSPTPAGYLYADQYCVDCTLRGTTTKPSFWK